MPKIALQLKLNLENLTNFRPVGSDFRWYLKMKCTNCREASDHWQYVTAIETFEIPNSRGEANYVQKCKMCNRQSSLEIVKDSIGAYDYEKNREWQSIVVFECRGIEPVEFDPRMGWAAVGVDSDTKFTNIDLSEKDWADYDEKAGESVGVYEFECQFERAINPECHRTMTSRALDEAARLRCRKWNQEDHGIPLYDCSFNPYYSGSDDEGAIFATVGSNRATVYRCTEHQLKPIYCFMDPDAEEQFFACTWLHSLQSHILSIGGKRGVIHLIPFCGDAGLNHLVGHGQAINDLVTHPRDPQILLSGSKDHELRLWNIQNGVCIAIFGGDGGHRSEVLTCDFDLLGDRIVSGGMDHCIKIWSISDNQRVKEALQQSKDIIPNLRVGLGSFPTVKVTQPDLNTLDVHKNYVDCVRWFGETLISKSCESSICHWKPGSQRALCFTKGETDVSLLRRCRLPSCDLWFIKFSIDYQFKHLAAGNQVGRIYLWDLHAFSASPKCLHTSKCMSVIRKVAFSPHGTILIAVCEDATVWRWTQKDTCAGGST